MSTSHDTCIVNTKEGRVRGTVLRSDQLNYYKFSKIPYAEPPIGSLRFLPPVPVKAWNEIKDCTQEMPLPLQYIFKKPLEGSEDCLYIQVYTPCLNAVKPLPVMFWIVSCGFIGTINNYLDPKTLIDGQQIVFVTCHFRIGLFGFLSINDYKAPGNCGLKDVVMALKWVQRNISEFGGDPNNVTIFGSSSGGSIVHLMMLSPMASGLFHKAIIQSASALNNWSLTKNPEHSVIELANELKLTAKCKLDLVEEMCLMPADVLMEAWKTCYDRFEERDIFHFSFKPCVEQELEGQPAFLTKSPIAILKSGNYNKVPLIIGSNNMEGCVIEYMENNIHYNLEKFHNDVSLLVPKSLIRSAKWSQNIGEKLLEFYFSDKEHLIDTKQQYQQLVSDYYFLYYVYKTVKLHSQHTKEFPIYYYILNYNGQWSVPDFLQFFNTLGHCGELPFLFNISSSGLEFSKGSPDSVKTRKRMVKMWINFAKYGNPTPDEDDQLLQITWNPVEGPDKLNYLSIGSELTKGRNPFQERMKFWDKLYKDFTLLRTLMYFNDLGSNR